MFPTFGVYEASQVPTFSQVFFAGRGFISRAIALRTCTWTQLLRLRLISHVGLVYKHWWGHDTEQLLVESTTLDTEPCCILKKKIKGVQAHYLAQRINEYDGHVWISRYRGITNVEQELKLDNAVFDKLGESYDTIGALIAGTTFFKRFWHFSPREWFCSELDAWLLRHCGINPITRRLRNGYITPAELADRVPVHRGNIWSPLVMVK